MSIIDINQFKLIHGDNDKECKLTPDTVLSKAIDSYESVLLIGYNKDGSLDVRASSNIDHKDVLFLIELFKKKLLNGDYSE